MKNCEKTYFEKNKLNLIQINLILNTIVTMKLKNIKILEWFEWSGKFWIYNDKKKMLNWKLEHRKLYPKRPNVGEVSRKKSSKEWQVRKVITTLTVIKLYWVVPFWNSIIVCINLHIKNRKENVWKLLGRRRKLCT